MYLWKNMIKIANKLEKSWRDLSKASGGSKNVEKVSKLYPL